MKKEHITKMSCGECKRINYHTRRNKKSVEKKLELRKFCRWCRKSTLHREIKK